MAGSKVKRPSIIEGWTMICVFALVFKVNIPNGWLIRNIEVVDWYFNIQFQYFNDIEYTMTLMLIKN